MEMLSGIDADRKGTPQAKLPELEENFASRHVPIRMEGDVAPDSGRKSQAVGE
jgi:hypothetical protein